MNDKQLHEFLQEKASLFLCENALMRQLYLGKKADPNAFPEWQEKEKQIKENLNLIRTGHLSEELQQLKQSVLAEAKIDEKTALNNLKIAWDFYYQAEKNDRLHNDPIYHGLIAKAESITEEERITLEKIEKELRDSATSNAKGVDITQPASLVQWDRPCAQYNPVDRPGRYFFPLEDSITDPNKLGTLNINIWSVINALKSEGASLRPLTPYKPIKPILALKSVASATIDHWSLSHPGAKREVITPGGADQLFIPFPRRNDPKESKSIFDTMMKRLPQMVLEENLYKDLSQEDPMGDLEQKIRASASKKIGNSISDYRAKRRQKTIDQFSQIESVNDIRNAVLQQMDVIDMALCLSAEQEQVFKNHIINNQGEKTFNTFKDILSEKQKPANLSPENKKDLASLREIDRFKKHMQARKNELQQLLNEQKSLPELKAKLERQIVYVSQEIAAHRKKNISVTVSKPGLWNKFLRKIGWIKEHPRQAIAFAAATVFTGGLAAKVAALHFVALGTYKIAVGLVAGSATAAATMKCSTKPIKKMIQASRMEKKPEKNKAVVKPKSLQNMTPAEKQQLPRAELNANQQAHMTYLFER
jgi:hypothetical protein